MGAAADGRGNRLQRRNAIGASASLKVCSITRSSRRPQEIANNTLRDVRLICGAVARRWSGRRLRLRSNVRPGLSMPSEGHTSNETPVHMQAIGRDHPDRETGSHALYSSCKALAYQVALPSLRVVQT
jgi:hypothetical protein